MTETITAVVLAAAFIALFVSVAVLFDKVDKLYSVTSRLTLSNKESMDMSKDAYETSLRNMDKLLKLQKDIDKLELEYSDMPTSAEINKMVAEQERFNDGLNNIMNYDPFNLRKNAEEFK